MAGAADRRKKQNRTEQDAAANLHVINERRGAARVHDELGQFRRVLAHFPDERGHVFGDVLVGICAREA